MVIEIKRALAVIWEHFISNTQIQEEGGQGNVPM